ncbi:MAG: NUDIX hydrolase [Anaerolineales bacterium]
MKPKITNQAQIYQGKVFNVRTDQLRFEDGRQVAYDIVEHPGSVTIIPVDDDGLIWLIRQYRHPAGGSLLEFPAGTLEKDEDPEACALRECQEEIGMAPGELDYLGSFYLAPGYSTEETLLYLARDLRPARLEGDDNEIIEAEAFSIDEIYDLIATEQLQDAKTLAGLILALPLLDDDDIEYIEA